MDPNGGVPSVNEAVEVLEAQLGRLRVRYEADRRNIAEQLTQKDAEIERLSTRMRLITQRADTQQNEFERLRTSGRLWRTVAHIKIVKLDEVSNLHTEASRQLALKIDMNQQLLRLLQESSTYADDLRRTSMEDKERLEREKEELSQQVCELAQTNNLLTSQLASLRQDFARRQRIFDQTEAAERQREEERSRMEGQMLLSEQMANACREENQQLQSRIAILERQKYVLEEQVKAAREESRTFGIRVLAAEAALRERNG